MRRECLKKGLKLINPFLVGVAGFEPATSCSQSRRDDRATLHPECRGCKTNQIKQTAKLLNFCGERGIRTPDTVTGITP